MPYCLVHCWMLKKYLFKGERYKNIKEKNSKEWLKIKEERKKGKSTIFSLPHHQMNFRRPELGFRIHTPIGPIGKAGVATSCEVPRDTMVVKNAIKM